MSYKKDRRSVRELKLVREAAKEAIIVGPMDETEVKKVIKAQKDASLDEYLEELKAIGERGRRR